MISPSEISPVLLQPESLQNPLSEYRFSDLRGVRWRINLGVLPSSLSYAIDELRRVTANSRRRYACLRKRLLIDPNVRNFNNECDNLIVDNPLSQNPDSTWGRFFLNAELEKMVDNDLCRLYPEHGSYFQTRGCQGMLRRILLLWCLRHPECGYRQGMHELLAPLLYVLHADLQHLNQIRKLYEDHFVDKFDEHLLHESLDFSFKISSSSSNDDDDFQQRSKKRSNLNDLDANVQSIVLLSDPYGAEGELGIVLSERFIEHDAYCMFDALMSGSGGDVAMSSFFSHYPASATQAGLAPVIEASLALYHLLSIVDSSLYTHLVELGVEPQYFALRWLRVLFGREFSLADLLIVWDEIFSFSNCKSVKATERDQGILNSHRGAFISAMAVSMMLHVRSSLLATEYVTSCLQRLLNFPEKVDLEKLIGKAKSLVTLAMEANLSSHFTPVIEHGSHVRQGNTKDHNSNSISLNLSFPRIPLSVTPERYWEEKWRAAQEEEETKKKNSINQVSSKRKGWAEKIKTRLLRTESDPCPLRRESREIAHESSVRRSLLVDLDRQHNTDEDFEETEGDKSSSHNDPLSIGSHAEVLDVMVEMISSIDKICSASSTSSEDNSPSLLEPASPIQNDTENSSSKSKISHPLDTRDAETQNYSFDCALNVPPPLISDSGVQNCSPFDSAIDEPSLLVSDFPHANSYDGFDADNISRVTSVAVVPSANTREIPAPDNTPKEPQSTKSKELKTFSGKFQWLLNFGRHNSGVETSGEMLQTNDAKSADGGSLQGNKGGSSADEANCSSLSVREDGSDQSLACTLRNLGHSMLENIQVLESAFKQEKNQSARIDNLSKHALVEKGQVTALSALKQLRNISNLLREM